MSMFTHFYWAPAVLSIGSNVGDRMANLQSALDSLDANHDVEVVDVSPVYETAPVGGPEQDAFLNAVVVVKTLLDPRMLLDVTQRLEEARGRTRVEHWGPRTLDVDLVHVAGYTMTTAALSLPHPRAHERAFVLTPWLDVDPEAELPGHGRVDALAAAVADQDVRRRDDLRLLFVGGNTGPEPEVPAE